MARPLRIEFPGAVYHVTSRGDRREPISVDDAGRRGLLGVVEQAMDRFDAQVLAYRPNIYCKFDLRAAASQAEAHYTIAVVRVPDMEDFRSDSRLYSQKDIQSESMIPRSTAKFFTHHHEVGHLLGLGHVGHNGHTNVHADSSPKAYGVTQREMLDVMGRGTLVRHWHALPWQEAAATFTNTRKKDWGVHLRHHIYPVPLAGGHH